MIEKIELLKGTREELEDYFYKELKIMSRSDNNFYLDLAKNSVAYAEISDTNTIKKQIEEVSKYEKPIGMVACLKAIRTDEIKKETDISSSPVEPVVVSPKVNLTVESKFIYVINKEIRDKIMKELYNKE